MKTSNSIGQGSLDLDVPGAQGELELIADPGEKLLDEAQRSIDDLVAQAGRYRSSKDFGLLLSFLRQFHYYSPFNALLVDIQLPGAKLVATAERWLKRYGRHVRATARPLIVLRPRGPVLIVYDVSDTEPRDDAARIPIEATQPFRFSTGLTDSDCAALIDRITDNALRDGVRVAEGPRATHRGGDVRTASGVNLERPGTARTAPESVPLRYEIVVNSRLDSPARLRVLAHELAHVYCGHLGSPDDTWWPSRDAVVTDVAAEFEADAAAWIALSRLDPHATMDQNLAQYLGSNEEVPQISLSRVLAVANLIEMMTERRLPSRERETARKERPRIRGGA